MRSVTPSVNPPAPSEVDPRRADLRVAELAELGVLTASLLHELRQPLFAVKGRLQIARHADRPLSVDELEVLLHHVGHIEELVEHYAGLGRSDDSWSEIDLRAEVLCAAAMLAQRVVQAGAVLETDLGDSPVLVRGRTVAVRQVVLNLVGNALDAVAGRERRVVTVEVRCVGQLARLVVSDSGPGVADTVRDSLFEPFVTTKPPGRGTGLGLYIARKLLDEAGGELRAERAEGGGARLVVELPRIG